MHAGKCVTRERKIIGSTCSRFACLVLPLAAQRSLTQGLASCQSRRRLNDSDRKQATHATNAPAQESLKSELRLKS
jgi:hypothetical protein